MQQRMFRIGKTLRSLRLGMGMRVLRSLSTVSFAQLLAALTIGPLLLGAFLEQVISLVSSTVLSAIATAAETPYIDIHARTSAQLLVDADALPLRTSGRWIVDQRERRVRLRCVNWYGAHLEAGVVGGLHHMTLNETALKIRNFGFNCVRLPYSLDLQFGFVEPASGSLRANPWLLNASGMEVLDATIAALTSLHILVILNNHQGRAMWCCSEDDGEGLWYTDKYPEETWLGALTSLAARYKNDPYVVGYDLRNELRGSLSQADGSLRGQMIKPQWGEGGEKKDWAAAAVRGGLAVSASDPDALIIVEGIDFATDLRGLHNGGRVHEEPALRGRVVYEIHDYTWYHPEYVHSMMLYWLCIGWLVYLLLSAYSTSRHGDTLRPKMITKAPMLAVVISCWSLSAWLASYSHYERSISEKWGFLLEGGEAPVWLGEFGTNGPYVTDSWWKELGETAWWSNILRYIRQYDMDYAYWAFNGDNAGQEETFGLLTSDYGGVRYSWLIDALP